MSSTPTSRQPQQCHKHHHRQRERTWLKMSTRWLPCCSFGSNLSSSTILPAPRIHVNDGRTDNDSKLYEEKSNQKKKTTTKANRISTEEQDGSEIRTGVEEDVFAVLEGRARLGTVKQVRMVAHLAQLHHNVEQAHTVTGRRCTKKEGERVRNRSKEKR